MRIVIDLQGAQTESRFRGIGRYSLSIALSIARNAGDDEVWIALSSAFPDTLSALRAAFAALVPSERIVSYAVPSPVAEHHPANWWRARAAEPIRAHFLAALQPDVVLVTSVFEGYVDDAVTAIPAGAPFPVAAILYDLIPYLNPSVYLPTATQRQYYERKIAALRSADLLLAISDYSRREAIATLGLDADRVVNVSTAVDADHFRPLEVPAAQQASLLTRFGIVREMVMYAPGGFDHRKNFDGLIAAFGALPASLRAQYQLVIVSRIGRADRAALEQSARNAGLGEGELILTGYVSEEDLVILYNSAALFVFPSLHEGFGLPVLEAMACGAPVIGAGTTSVPEVIGLPGALFDPSSVPAISAKLHEMLVDSGARLALREHGLRQAARFSWDKSGKAALAAMRALFGSNTPAAENWPTRRTQADAAYRGMLKQVAQACNSAPHMPDGEMRQLSALIATNLEITDRIVRSRHLPPVLRWRLEGPFDSSYSLALLNRETALALDAMGHDVALHSTEGPGDFAPSPAFLHEHPRLAALHARTATMPQDDADACSRNLYPPRVVDMHSPLNLLHHYAWEESAFPQEWVEQFNRHLHGMTCLSQHVQKVMVDQGVSVPMRTSGCGVDHWLRVRADASYPCPGKAFRFLHVSSCFPRKGADVLLRAYGDAFRSSDDVTLVIKTFANPHNEVHRWLEQARGGDPAFPDVVIIEADLSDAQLKGLMEQCHALVAPSRAEGFAMPLAEAMLSGLPAITTGWSGQRDFCNDDTAWLIDYSFAPAQTHFGLFGSVWAEPDRAHLCALLREVRTLPPAERHARAARGRELLLEKFTWRSVAQRLVDAAREFAAPAPRSPQKIGWVTTWNTKCGIATYSAHLVECVPAEVVLLAPHAQALTGTDGAAVRRCWESGDDDTLGALAAAIEEADITTLVVQFNYGFFHLERLAEFLLAQRAAGRVVIVMMHATVDPSHAPHKRLALLVPALQACSRILVHSPADLNRLKAHQLVDNVTLFPHGVLDWPAAPAPAPDRTFTLASYGFFLPHKGLPQLVEALAMLVAGGRDVCLHMVNAEYPVGESAALIAEVRDSAARLGMAERIVFSTDFLDDRDSLQRLSEADLIVFPYQNTGESSSGAVRYGLASGRPVAVTPLAIFDDVARATFRLPGQDAASLASGLAALIDDIRAGAPRVVDTGAEADRWRTAHRYSRLGVRLHGMMAALHESLQSPVAAKAAEVASAPALVPVVAAT